MNNLFIIKANILVERVNRTFRIPDPYAMTILDIKNLRCIDGGGITMSNTIKVLGELLPQNGKEIIKCISMLKIIFLRKYQRSLYPCKYFILTIVWSSSVWQKHILSSNLFLLLFKGKPSAVNIYRKNHRYWETFDSTKSRPFVCEQGLKGVTL